MIADKQTLQDVSGLHRPSAIRRWLDRQGIAYVMGADGWPKALQSAILGRLGGQPAPPKAEPQLRLRNG